MFERMVKFCVKQTDLTAGKGCGCGECDDRCELDPSKICDNCFRCLDAGRRPYAEIPIGGVLLDDSDPIAALFSLRPDLESGDFLLDSDGGWREEPLIFARTLPRAHASRKRRM